jgi:hypothetical protein
MIDGSRIYFAVVKMAIERTIQRALVDSFHLRYFINRLNRVLIHLSDHLSRLPVRPTLDEILALCCVMSPIACIVILVIIFL